jgi:uncharacterized membrane protein YeaQ/YmgE (transglycosylase-associated protein family)
MKRLIFSVALVLVLGLVSWARADESVKESAQNAKDETVQKVKQTAADIEQRTADTVKDLKENGLSTQDLVALIAMGALTAGVVGNLLMPSRSRLGVIIDLIIGSVGAFLGALIVRVLKLDFGWPTVSFHLETLLVAFVIAVVLVVFFAKLLRGTHRATAPRNAPAST